MKPSLKPWEIGLAERVKQHEFDFEPGAYAQFEQLLAAEAAVGAATSTTASAWWTSTMAKITLFGLAVLAGVSLYLFFPENVTPLAETPLTDLTTVTQPGAPQTKFSPTLLSTLEPATESVVQKNSDQAQSIGAEAFSPNPAPARRRPPILEPLAQEQPVSQNPVMVAAANGAPSAIKQIKATALLPGPAAPSLAITPIFSRQVTTAPVQNPAPFKRDRSSLFPDIKPRQ